MAELLRPDIPGDTVRFDPPVAASPPPPLWFYPFSASILAALTWTRFTISGSSDSVVFLWCAWAVVMGIWELIALYQGWLLRRLVPRGEPDSLEALALQLWHAGLSNRGLGLRLDAGRWIDATGPAGARLIAIGFTPPAVQTPPDITEAVDMGTGRRTSRSERWWLVFMVVMSLVQIGIQLLPVGPRSNPMFWVGASFWFAYAAWALNRLGVRLFSITAAVATPGRLETSRFGRDAEFARHDSVLVLHSRGGGRGASVTATFIRRDGRRYAILFAYAANGEHPALADLLSRWCCREGNVIEQTHFAVVPDRAALTGGDADGRTAEA